MRLAFVTLAFVLCVANFIVVITGHLLPHQAEISLGIFVLAVISFLWQLTAVYKMRKAMKRW